MASAACGASPSAPQPATTLTAPTLDHYLVSGTLTATNGGFPISDATLTTDGFQVTSVTDAAGHYSVTKLLGSPSDGVPFSLTVDGPVFGRRIFARFAGLETSLNIDAIALQGFDVGLYRALVRNGYESPGGLQRLRRWTRAPQIYLRTIDEQGAAISNELLSDTETALRESVHQWTNGQFEVAAVTRGTESRVGQPGWITVIWPSPADPDVCGRANVATEGGTIWINYLYGPGCACAATHSPVRIATVRHEVGHAMGFWHTGNTNDLMSGKGSPICDILPTSRELAVSAIAYRRPVGNADPDYDPSDSFVNLATVTPREPKPTGPPKKATQEPAELAYKFLLRFP